MLEHKLSKKHDTNLNVFNDHKLLVNWHVAVTTAAGNCRNYIRNIVDNLHLAPNPEKPVIALSLGPKPPKTVQNVRINRFFNFQATPPSTAT